MSSAMRRGFVAGLCSLALLPVGAVHAQDDRDLLKETRQRLEVEAQRVEAEVEKTRNEAYRIGQTSPAAAVERLKTALTLLEDDKSLKETRRESLIRSVRYDMRHFEVK